MREIIVLLVEDSASDVRLIKEALRDEPMSLRIVEARDGVEALEYLRRSEAGSAARPDLVLLDLNLPRKSGREVLAEIKSAPGLKQIPVIVMTSSRADEDITAAYSLNANCYITKPIELDGYLNVVRAIEDFWFRTATLPDGYATRPIPVASQSRPANRFS